MILQALHAYYERQRDTENSPLPARGFERKEIRFVLDIDQEGRFVELHDTETGEGRMRRARVFTVPKGKKRSGLHAWKTAYLLWDHPGYVVGFARDDDQERAQKQHGSFITRIEESFGDTPNDIGVAAALRFLKAGNFEAVFHHPLWEEVSQSNGNIALRLTGEERLICQRQAVRSAVEAAVTEEVADKVQCLITGTAEPLARLHPAIKGVRGAQTSGANIVSFNLDAFASHGRKQGANAPVGEAAAFAYTTGLNHLLRKDSRQKAQIGDMTVVFWAAEENPIQDLAAALLGGSTERKDDPDLGVEQVRSMYNAPWHGRPPLKNDRSEFYVLGLAPNASRIAVRVWHQMTISDMAERILTYFDEIEIVRPAWEEQLYTPLTQMLRSVAVQRKLDNIPSNLAGDIFRSVITGRPYPRTMLSSAVQRCRMEQHVSSDRAALIKAWLAREARFGNSPSEKEVPVALDRARKNVGYRLGRLFAACERAQELANPGINRTVRETYYGTASTSPRSVFPRLMTLSTHHLRKIESRGAATNLDKLFQEIAGDISDFPAVLPMEDQGRFSLGYYHQRQDFFTKSPSNGNGEE